MGTVAVQETLYVTPACMPIRIPGALYYEKCKRDLPK